MAEPKFVVLMETETKQGSKLLSILGWKDTKSQATGLLKEKLEERLKDPSILIDGVYYIAQVKSVLVAKARREVDLLEREEETAPATPAAAPEPAPVPDAQPVAAAEGLEGRETDAPGLEPAPVAGAEEVPAIPPEEDGPEIPSDGLRDPGQW